MSSSFRPPSFLYTSFVSPSDPHNPPRFLSPSPSPPIALKHRPSQLLDASYLDSGSALPSATDMLPADETQHDGVKRTTVGRGNHLRMNALHHSLHITPDSWLFAPDPSVSGPLHPDEKVQMCAPLLPPESPIASKFRESRPMPYILRKFYPTGLVKKIDDLKDYPTTWLVLYFVLNLSLTLYNKSVLIHFPFPYTLTAMHALCGAIGTFIWVRLESGNTSPSTSAPVISQPLLGIAGWPSLSCRQIVVLILFSFLYTINIVVSNASLRLVTVPFHQVVRASTPFFTIIFSAALLSKPCSQKKLLSLVPVVAGVGFATYGDYYFTAFGFMLTLLGTVLAAMKTIITNIILIKPSRSQSISLPLSVHSPMYSAPVSPSADLKQNPFPNPHHRHTSAFPAEPNPNPPASSFLVEFLTPLPTFINNIFAPSPASSPKRMPATLQNDLKSTALSETLSISPGFFTLPKLTLSPLHLLLLLSPLAFVETMILAYLTGELGRVRCFLLDSSRTGVATPQRTWLLLNGVLAFFLNVVSFNANRRLGPLAMTVAANVKQVLTVLCAVVIFNLTITPANGIGIVLTLMGGALYAAVELKEKKEIKRRRRM